jgi:hypothetical protein
VLDLPISVSSVRRARLEATSDRASDVKQQFRDLMEDRKKLVVAHFDSKEIEDQIDDIENKDRLAILVSSPHFGVGPPHYGQPQLLGIPAVPNGTGAEMSKTVLQHLDDWNARENIIGLCYDTTSSNSGGKNGACINIEKGLGHSCLCLPCRRHIYELHIKWAVLAISGRPSKSPGETIFKTFQANWNSLKDSIDMKDLVKFDWAANKDTFIEEQAEKALRFCLKCLSEGTFPRADYRELCQLIVVWLGGPVKDFKFQRPKNVSSARFMQKAIKYTAMEVLSKQYRLFEPSVMKEIKSSAEFVGLYHGMWFLKSALAAQAPLNDLTAISEMRQYRAKNKVAAEACLKSMGRHLDYLTPPLIVFALADDSVLPEERKCLARALYAIPRPDTFPLGVSKTPNSTFPFDSKIWKNETPPSLSHFVGPTSWETFDKLGMTEAQCEWLQLEVHQWPLIQGFRDFRDFVTGLTPVNDPAERGVQVALDLKDRTRKEETTQNVFIAITQDRKEQPKKKGRTDVTKASLAKKGKML